MIFFPAAFAGEPVQISVEAPVWRLRPPDASGPLTLDALAPRTAALALGACGPDGAPFVGAGAPVVCPLPPPLVWRVEAPDVAVGFAAVRDRVGDLDEAWRASLLQGPRGTAPATLVVPDDGWAWSEGDRRALLREDVAVDAGELVGDDLRCVVRAAAGSVDLAPACEVPTAATATLRLFPLVDAAGATSWGLVATITRPIVAAPPPPAPTPWLPWTIAGGLAAGHLAWIAAAFWMSRRPAPPPRAPVPARPPKAKPPERPAPTRPTPRPAPPRAPADPYLSRQIALLGDQPALRAWAERLGSDAVGGWLGRGDAALTAAGALPPGPVGYAARLDELVRDLRTRHADLARVRGTLDLARRAPERFVESATPDERAAWKAIVPWTEARPADGGAALAAVGDVDLVRTAFVPWLALAQVLIEALPHERPDLPPVDLGPDPFGAAAPDVRALGFAWRHVPLYTARDTDFLLDADVALVGLTPPEIWADLPAPEVPAGVVVRVRQPILRPLDGAGRPPRAQLVLVREESP